MYLTSGYVYESAAAAEKAFTGEIDRYVYSRYGNPTISMFEAAAADRGRAGVRHRDSGWPRCSPRWVRCSAGDRLVAARSLFGSCFVVCNEILPRWGVEVEFVDGDDLSRWEAALSVPTQAVFLKPVQPDADAGGHRRGLRARPRGRGKGGAGQRFATPLLQQGMPLGADVVVYPGTKHIDGRAGCLGRAILGDKGVHRRPGADVDAAHRSGDERLQRLGVAQGLETLAVRVDYGTRSAPPRRRNSRGHPAVRWVRYPYLPSHLQHELATRQMSGGETVVTFELDAPGRPGQAAGVRVVGRPAGHRHLQQPR